MIRYALDTNTLSCALRNEGRVRERLGREDPAQIGVPAPCAFEIKRGARLRGFGRERMQRVDRLLQAFTDLPFDAAAAEHAASIAAALAKAGTPIGPFDLLIAGVARANGAALVTRNQAEFGRVEGLLLEDWYAAAWPWTGPHKPVEEPPFVPPRPRRALARIRPNRVANQDSA